MDEGPKRIKRGGRQKGTPNKSTAEFRALMQLCGFNLPSEIVALYRATDNDIVKFKLLELLAAYSYTKPKVEISKEEENSDQDDDQIITIEDVLNIVDVTPRKKIIE